MNSKQIIVDVFTEGKEHRTAYLSNFKRKAKIAKKDNFVEFDDFFNDCLHSIKFYKNEIEKQYNKRLKENNWVLNSINSGNGIKIDGELIIDTNDKKLKESLDYCMNDKKYVEERGFKSNRDYSCQVSTTGEISKDIFEIKHKFYYADLELLEEAMITAQKELQHISDDGKPKEPKSAVDNQKDGNVYIPTKEKFEKYKDSGLPTINKKYDYKKYDPEKIYINFFRNELFNCSKDCFYAWLVYGKEYNETITYNLKGRKSKKSGVETLNLAQLKKFIIKITGDEENTKDAFYDRIFGLTIRTSTIKTSNVLNVRFEKLKDCEKPK
jgi:hypothetical protein